MKKIQYQVLTFAILVVGFLFTKSLEAETTPKNTPQNKTPRFGTMPRQVTRVTKPLLREDSSSMNRWFEVRAGPRFAIISGAIRPGGDGSSLFDLRKDLKLDDIFVGPQLDFAMHINDWHVNVDYALGLFEGKAITDRQLLYNSSTNPTFSQEAPATLPRGSQIFSDIELHALTVLFRYDALRTDKFILGPLFGLKAAFVEENIRFINATTGAVTTNRTNLEEATPLVGFEAKYQFNRNLYLGIAPVGFAFDNYVYVGGQGYVGVDFNKSFGLRLGVDTDYLSAARDSSSHYAITGTLLAAYLQGIYGF